MGAVSSVGDGLTSTVGLLRMAEAILSKAARRCAVARWAPPVDTRHDDASPVWRAALRSAICDVDDRPFDRPPARISRPAMNRVKTMHPPAGAHEFSRPETT